MEQKDGLTLRKGLLEDRAKSLRCEIHSLEEKLAWTERELEEVDTVLAEVAAAEETPPTRTVAEEQRINELEMWGPQGR
jgi:chromosome segregation ATPase